MSKLVYNQKEKNKMKTNGEFKKDNLETLEEWQEYAKRLESMLLTRPTPKFETENWVPNREWAEEYENWWSEVVGLW
jgi:hypothetical protein